MKARLPVVLLNDTRIDRHFGCELVCSAIEELLDEVGLEIIASAPAHADWRKDESVLRAIEQARLLLVNGEGTIHHDRPAGRILLEAGREARLRGIPCALINAGWEANSSALVSMLDDFTLVSARDGESAALMSDGRSEVHVVPDLSIFATRRRLASRAGSEPAARSGIGYTDSVDRFQTVRIGKYCSAQQSRPINIHTQRRGYFGFLRAGLSLREDWQHPTRLYRLIQARHGLWRARLPDMDAFIESIRALQLLVSGRFHACTVALATSTPLMGVRSNTAKIARLLADAGLQEWRGQVDLVDIPFPDREFDWTDQERSHLNDYLDLATCAPRKLFTELVKLAK